LAENYTVDISDFDMIEAQAMMMADSIADGIVKQFPQMFVK
jgi:hypothetical protein